MIPLTIIAEEATMFGSSSTNAAALAFACAALLLTAPVLGRPQAGSDPTAEGPLQVHGISSAVVASQLGVKLSPEQPAELAIGGNLTGSLEDATKLTALGVAGARAGARVTVMRVAEERLIVEVDEVDPVARSRRVTLRLHSDGQLSMLTP